MRSTPKLILAASLALFFAGLGIAITIAIADRWPAPRVGVLVTASTGMFTLLGLLAALENSNYLRREQLAEQRETAFQRTIDREVAYRNRSLAATSAVISAMTTAITRYENDVLSDGLVAEESGALGPDKLQSARQKFQTWQSEWTVASGTMAIQMLHVPAGVRYFLEHPLEQVDRIASGPDQIDDVNIELLAEGLEGCRLAKQGIKYFEGLAAANLDPQVDVVLEYFTNVGSGPLIEPETGNLVGPNYPDVRRQSEIHHVPQQPGTQRPGIGKIFRRRKQGI